jgi:hypothetical protein
MTPQNSKPSSVLILLSKEGHMMTDSTQISQPPRSMYTERSSVYLFIFLIYLYVPTLMHTLRILIQQFLPFYDLVHRCMEHVIFNGVTTFVYKG